MHLLNSLLALFVNPWPYHRYLVFCMCILRREWYDWDIQWDLLPSSILWMSMLCQDILNSHSTLQAELFRWCLEHFKATQAKKSHSMTSSARYERFENFSTLSKSGQVYNQTTLSGWLRMCWPVNSANMWEEEGVELHSNSHSWLIENRTLQYWGLS